MEAPKNNEETTKKEKNYIYLKAFAIIFYVIAVVLIVYGIFSIIGYAYTIVSESQSNWFVENNFFNPDDFVDTFEDNMEHLNISGMLKGFEFIIGGVVLIVVASILMKVYHKKTYTLKEKEVEKETDNLFDAVRITISEGLKQASDKIRPASDKNSDTEEKKPKQKIYCAYCGSELDENDKKCPGCGASKKFRK